MTTSWSIRFVDHATVFFTEGPTPPGHLDAAVDGGMRLNPAPA